ncbi:MAG: PspC domain-containing protein [Melioribacteraceae bacterium]|nr:PspC domain-containing protein [Melioribacteraceae bacterium]
MEKRLYRSRKWRVFGGVAGGLAEYFGLDPVLMRVIFVLITLFSGIGILLYIILWIVIPEIPFEIAYQIKPEDQTTKDGSNETFQPPVEVKSIGKGRIVVGVVLIIIGMLFFFERFIPSFNFEDFFPALLIIIGLALIWNSVRK